MKKSILLFYIVILASFFSANAAAETLEPWYCHVCGTRNTEEVCEKCGHEHGSWRCPKCNEINTGDFCSKCGLNKNDIEVKEYGDGIYIGELLNEKRHGFGFMFFADKDDDNRKEYAGQWKDDRREGKGRLTWNNGDSFDGEWKNDMRNGNGTYTWADGFSIKGIWSNDKRIGTRK